MSGTATPKKENDGVSMNVRLSGSPEKVKESMGDLSGTKDGQPAPEVTKSHSAIKEALAHPTNSARALRLSPKKDQMGREYKNYQDFPCPTSRSEIERQIRDEYGGHRWHVHVMDEEGYKIAGFNLQIEEKPRAVYEDPANDPMGAGAWPQLPGLTGPVLPGMGQQHPGLMGQPPSLPQDWAPQGDAGGMDEEEEETDPLDEIMETISKGKARELKMAQIEKLLGGGSQKDAVAEAIEKVTGQFTDVVDEIRSSTEKQIEAMRSELREQKHARELEAERQRHQSELAKLETKIEQLMNRGDPKADLLELARAMKDDDKFFKVLLEQNRASSDNFKEIVGMVTRQKPENALDTVNSVMGAMGNMANMMGWGRGDDDLPFESRLLKTINEVTPEVLKTYREEKAKGRELTEDVLSQKVEEVTTKLLPTLKDEVRSSINEQAKKIMGRVPGAPAPSQRKPSSPAPNQPQQPQPAPDKLHLNSGQVDEMLSVQEELKGRVTQALIILGRELQVRPADAKWIDFVYDNFPPELIEQLATAPNPIAFIQAIQPYVPEEILGRIVGMLKSDAKAVEWLKDQAQVFREGFFGPAGQEPAVAPPAEDLPQSTEPPPEGGPGEGMVVDPTDEDAEVPVVFDAPTEAPGGVVDLQSPDYENAGPLGGGEPAPADTGAPGPLGGLAETEPPAPEETPPEEPEKEEEPKAKEKGKAKKAVRKKKATKKKATKKSS